MPVSSQECDCSYILVIRSTLPVVEGTLEFGIFIIICVRHWLSSGLNSQYEVGHIVFSF